PGRRRLASADAERRGAWLRSREERGPTRSHGGEVHGQGASGGAAHIRRTLRSGWAARAAPRAWGRGRARARRDLRAVGREGTAAQEERRRPVPGGGNLGGRRDGGNVPQVAWRRAARPPRHQ